MDGMKPNTVNQLSHLLLSFSWYQILLSYARLLPSRRRQRRRAHRVRIPADSRRRRDARAFPPGISRRPRFGGHGQGKAGPLLMPLPYLSLEVEEGEHFGHRLQFLAVCNIFCHDGIFMCFGFSQHRRPRSRGIC